MENMVNSRSLRFAAAFVVLACGDASKRARGVLDPTGGELCLEARRVCVIAPPGALTEATSFQIELSPERPAAALGEAFNISVTGKASVRFQNRLVIEFATTEAETLTAGLDPSIFRIFTKHDGDWESLESPVLDRVKHSLSAQTNRFSPFVLLRADRLPDGGIPVEFDGGQAVIDPVIQVPPRPDSGKPVEVDAGRPVVDSGIPDSGRPNRPDAGRPDAGVRDAGVMVDAGAPDAGDMDSNDAGLVDAGP